ncbi:PepSY-associated TM helix domain-containing protein [Novosphingobium sp. B-7]|uniref:PepSY-associated TM helix domain-containing protein n=1 Tax=Novosphingobium sp. B-7 TaxID=1298855 RepID=UPI0003B70642|nr:PepSY-associated TM helix domain-containing protein [Novosphingobium sp. B-7]
MRKWHRWISVFFGVFLLWIAVTGTLSQVVPLLSGGDGDRPAKTMAEATPAKPAFVCPPDYMCRPKPKGGKSIVGLLHHLHSGESFGPAGVLISTLSGFAMIFFSFSGLWMYIQMWRNRKDRNLKPGWFWK